MLLCISEGKVEEQAGRWLQALSQLSESAVESHVILWRLRLLNSKVRIIIIIILTTLINDLWSVKISTYNFLLSEVEFYLINLHILWYKHFFFVPECQFNFAYSSPQIIKN